MNRKNLVSIGFSTICTFRQPWGSWCGSPGGKWENYRIIGQKDPESKEWFKPHVGGPAVGTPQDTLYTKGSLISLSCNMGLLLFASIDEPTMKSLLCAKPEVSCWRQK